MNAPPSARVTVFGATGTGKSAYLRRRWWHLAPKLLVLDHIGEYGARTNAVGLDDTLARLREVAHQRRWRIFASVTPEEINELAAVLQPFPHLTRSPALALGGMAVSIDEVDRVIGFGAGTELRDLWRRGRHVGLTIFAASQRPANVSKEVTSQSDVIALLHVHEPSDVAYMRDVMGAERLAKARAWLAAERYRVALYFPRTGMLGLYPPTNGKDPLT